MGLYASSSTVGAPNKLAVRRSKPRHWRSSKLSNASIISRASSINESRSRLSHRSPSTPMVTKLRHGSDYILDDEEEAEVEEDTNQTGGMEYSGYLMTLSNTSKSWHRRLMKLTLDNKLACYRVSRVLEPTAHHAGTASLLWMIDLRSINRITNLSSHSALPPYCLQLELTSKKFHIIRAASEMDQNRWHFVLNLLANKRSNRRSQVQEEELASVQDGFIKAWNRSLVTLTSNSPPSSLLLPDSDEFCGKDLDSSTLSLSPRRFSMSPKFVVRDNLMSQIIDDESDTDNDDDDDDEEMDELPSMVDSNEVVDEEKEAEEEILDDNLSQHSLVDGVVKQFDSVRLNNVKQSIVKLQPSLEFLEVERVQPKTPNLSIHSGGNPLQVQKALLSPIKRPPLPLIANRSNLSISTAPTNQHKKSSSEPTNSSPKPTQNTHSNPIKSPTLANNGIEAASAIPHHPMPRRQPPPPQLKSQQKMPLPFIAQLDTRKVSVKLCASPQSQHNQRGLANNIMGTHLDPSQLPRSRSSNNHYHHHPPPSATTASHLRPHQYYLNPRGGHSANVIPPAHHHHPSPTTAQPQQPHHHPNISVKKLAPAAPGFHRSYPSYPPPQLNSSPSSSHPSSKSQPNINHAPSSANRLRKQPIVHPQR